MADATTDTPSCTIKTLPPELLISAARVAADIFPPNRPAVAQFATLIRGEESDAVTSPQFIAALTTKYWGPTPRTIPVSFLDGPDDGTRRLILAHMNAWSEFGCIAFAETAGQGKVRIARGGSGYWSYLGTDVLLVPPGEPTMNLQGFTARTADAEYRRVVRHETGHTLGFPHEHMRASIVARIDPAKAVAYFGQTQGWSARDVYAQVLTSLDESTLMSTPADQTSIMCYQLPGEIMVDRRPVAGGTDINPSDGEFMAAIYPKPAGPTPPVTPPGPVEPPAPKPEPPPVRPPEPDAGPFDLSLGRVGAFTMLAGVPILFRFRTKSHREFVARTAGDLSLSMELLDAGRNRIEKDEVHRGKLGNAAIIRALRPGVYHLRVRGDTDKDFGAFEIKVEAAR